MAELIMDREQFRQMIKGKSDEELLEGFKGMEDTYIDAIMDGMVVHFDAAKAGNKSAIFQYDISTPVGLKQYQIIIENGACRIQKGAAEKPRATLKFNLPNFLRLMSGEIDGQRAFMSGQVKISGDVMFTRNLALWFNA